MRSAHSNGRAESRTPSADRSLDCVAFVLCVLQSLYADDDGLLPATFQVFYMIGWAPHASQPKPMERGTATTKMSEMGKIASEQQAAAAAATTTQSGCSKDSDAGASFVERDSSSS